MPSIPLPRLQEGDSLRVSGETHKGRVKRINQDAIGVWGPGVPLVEGADRGYLFCVADGMGGQPGGEIAARTITATLLEYFQEPVGGGADDVAALLVEAHRRVLERQATEPAIHKMGAVASCVWIREEAIEIVHAGDTRVYGVGAGRLEQLTADEAGTFGGIRNYVGMADPFRPSRRALRSEEWDWLLVCSDGLPKHVPDGRLLELVLELEGPDRIVQGLLEHALADGATDNVSVICVEFM